VNFDLVAAKTGSANAMVPHGQTITLPEGHFNKIYILAAAAGGDQSATFRVGGNSTNLDIQDWTGFIGHWDARLWKNGQERDWAISANHAVWPPADLPQREQRRIAPRYPEDYVGLKQGYIKPAELAWYASHLHTADGLNQPYQYSYLFAYPIEVGMQRLSLCL
jgi:alpha-mannosidase